MAEWAALSADLEPNKDNTLDGVGEAMDWFDGVVPRGTIYATHRIATELPEVVDRLAADHEIGVHVHPREFGHNHDQFANLDVNRQRELLIRTREALAAAAGLSTKAVTAFRAGRHSASERTFAVLSDLDFTVDASLNVRYTNYLPDGLTSRQNPFTLDSGLFELPTTWKRPPLLSRVGLRQLPGRDLTATANTLRTDRLGTTGLECLRWLFGAVNIISLYMHPYDATDHHDDLQNSGCLFRERFESLVDEFDGRFMSASDLQGQVQ